MKSSCLQCGRPVVHLAYERAFCSVGCNADYAIRSDPPGSPESEYQRGRADERADVVKWLSDLNTSRLITTWTIRDALERADHIKKEGE